MPEDEPAVAPSRREQMAIFAIFGLCLLFNLWGVRVGWESLNLPGHEFRQAQTALSTYFIQQEGKLALDYPTPVLGKPWAIPLEFPLYQWSVVAVSEITGVGMTKAGRLVSLACFYLMLPALYLLLDRFRVAPGRRWLVLALVLTSPLYIFYSRAFLIETMALMFGLWFWVGYERSVTARSWPWLMVASLAGAAAGLVKVTTFAVYLLPAFLWALGRLWSTRRQGRWVLELPWMLGAVLVPVAATFWWESYADMTRLKNPLAHFLGSSNLMSFTTGTWVTRFSPELWRMKWESTISAVSCLPVLVGCGLLVLMVGAARRRSVGVSVAYFAAPLAIFPILYGWHDYYFVANGVLLLTALGLVLVGLAEQRRFAGPVITLALVVVGGQALQYRDHFFPAQQGISNGGDGMSRALQRLTKSDELVVVLGQEWNPMFPYYAQRRMMMIRNEDEKNLQRLDAAFDALRGEKIGALVIAGPLDGRSALVRRVAAFGIDAEPIFVCQEMTVYLREDRRDQSIQMMMEENFSGTSLLPGAKPVPERLAAQWYEVAKLPVEKLGFFVGMNPTPVRFFSAFGLGIELANGRQDFGAHPVTRLVFSLPAGDRLLRTTVSLPEVAYVPAEPNGKTSDGVEIILSIKAGANGRRILFSRHLNPRDNLGDRGLVELRIPFHLEQKTEVELFFGPGPAGQNTFDWIVMGRLVIE